VDLIIINKKKKEKEKEKGLSDISAKLPWLASQVGLTDFLLYFPLAGHSTLIISKLLWI